MSASSLRITITALMAPRYSSSSARHSSKRRHPVWFYLCCMQPVLASRTCLALPNSLTSETKMRKKRESSPRMERLLSCSVFFYHLLVKQRSFQSRKEEGI